MNLEGFWIREEKYYEVQTTHINFVMEHTELFQISLEEIKDIFKNHFESIGFEGIARQEIFIELFRKGWIRVRHKVKHYGDLWTFEFSNIGDAAKPIAAFITKKSNEEFLFLSQSPLQLTGIDDGYDRFYSFAERGASAFLKEQGIG
jgi:hypothetical protein